MTMAARSTIEELRTRFQADLLGGMPGQFARLRWSREQIAAHQRDALRRLLAHARERSPFHAKRLAGIDVERFELAGIASLPIMTKAQMMSEFDDVVTDRRVTRASVESQLAKAGPTPELLDDAFFCLASGGSSGTRGVFVISWDAFVAYTSATLRPMLARTMASGGLPEGGLKIGLVAAPTAIHATRAMSMLLHGGLSRVIDAPSTAPLGEVVAALNAGQPHVLVGYPSMLRILAAEQQAGRLAIQPTGVSATSEQLTPEAAAAIAAAFGVPVVNTFGSTEGLMGSSEPGDEAIVFASDNCIVELVDEADRPVEPGVPSDRVLVTNLCNLAQPLIRYELNDSFVEQPRIAEHGHLRATVEGRSDDVLRYGDVRIHPLVVRSALVKAPEVTEYQVRQTERGVDIDVVVSGACDERAIQSRTAEALTAAGLAEPRVSVRVVPRIERHAETGKVRRFVPLASR